MHLEKCFLHVKVLKLFILFGAFSTIIVLMIYSLPNGETNSVTGVNQVLLSSWPIKSNAFIQANSNTNPNTNLNAKQEIPKIDGDGDGVRLSEVRSGNGIGIGIGNNVMRRKFEHRGHVVRDKIKRLTMTGIKFDDPASSNATQKLPKHTLRNVHIFYTVPVHWYHPNDSRHLDNGFSISDTNSKRFHLMQPNIVFYPQLGLYEPDNKTMQHHFTNIRLLGSSVLIITWSPAFQQYLLRQFFDDIEKFNVQIAIEIDDYPNRTAYSLINDIEYFHREFWHHASLYKVFVTSKSKYLPMFYIKCVDTLPVSDWSAIFSPNGVLSIRGSSQDAIFVGHISTKKHVSLIKTANFNGFYSRNVSNGANYASTWKYWSALKKSADKFKLLFIPTVGPGYNENRKQPKTGSTRRHRTNGQYFGVAWRAAIAIGAEFINIGSYNDWLSGTQIEEAVPKSGFKDYSPGTPKKYLDLTRYWINEYVQSWQTDSMKRIVDVKTCGSYFNNTIC